MLSAVAPRVMLRHSRFVARQTIRRHASTTEAASSAASKSKDAASNATSKASEGLSKVTSSAGPALRGAAQGVSTAVGRIGGRIGGPAGRVIGLVESMIPPTIYYSKVAFELSRLVFRGQKMSPPNLAAFQSYAQPLLNALRNPAGIFNLSVNSTTSISPETVFSRLRNINTQQMVSAGVVGAEVLGFFTVGEMVGRFKLVGYRGDVHQHETATPLGD